jgi:hypothetical protein
MTNSLTRLKKKVHKDWFINDAIKLIEEYFHVDDKTIERYKLEIDGWKYGNFAKKYLRANSLDDDGDLLEIRIDRISCEPDERGLYTRVGGFIYKKGFFSTGKVDRIGEWVFSDVIVCFTKYK